MYFYYCVSSFLREQLLNTHLVNGGERGTFHFENEFIGNLRQERDVLKGQVGFSSPAPKASFNWID